jgi:hypothetical protein
MNWIKKQWKKLSALLTALIIGTGIVVFNNGEHVTVTPSVGRHLLAPDFGTVYANQGRQIQLAPGQRYIQIGIVLDSGKVVQAFADTLDTPVKIGVLAKFIQCKK